MTEVIALTTAYGKIRAVDSLTVTVRLGRVPGFLGLSGSGKTTMLLADELVRAVAA